MFATKDVTFFESQTFFDQVHLQGENKSEDSHLFELELVSISTFKPNQPALTPIPDLILLQMCKPMQEEITILDNKTNNYV